MITTNFHTHTVFCDGKNTPEEMVLAAIEKGFTALGFSGHSYFEPEKDINMSIDDQKEYINQIESLKIKYRDKIKIFCGIEQDYYSESPLFSYEYKIGSVHNILKDGRFLDTDWSAERTKNTVENVYGGDFDSFAEDYFEVVSDVLNKTKADIIGHIDLISKFNEQNGYGESERYLKAAEKAVKKLIPYGKPFEINTGAMARGAKSIPYPSPSILKIIKENSGKIIFSSDCHDKDFLDFAFDKAVLLAKSVGFKEHGILTDDGIKYISL